MEQGLFGVLMRQCEIFELYLCLLGTLRCKYIQLYNHTIPGENAKNKQTKNNTTGNKEAHAELANNVLLRSQKGKRKLA